MLSRLRDVLEATKTQVVRELKVHQLVDGMILAADVWSAQGILLCAKGQEVNFAMRSRLKNYTHNFGIQGPIRVHLSVDYAGGETRVLLDWMAPGK